MIIEQMGHTPQGKFTFLNKILIALFALWFMACLFGCSSRYSAERLYWYANQESNSIIQGRPLDKLTAYDYGKIIAAYRRVVDKYPLEPLAAQSQLIIARLNILQRQYAQAERELINIIQNFSNNSNIASRAQFMIGNLYQMQGQWERALVEYEKVTDLYPLSRLGLGTPIYIAQHYQHSQNITQAERAYESAIRSYERIISDYFGTSVVPAIMEYLALAYLNQGSWDKAIEVWQTITNEYSGSPIAARSLLASGEIYARQIKDLEKAVQAYLDFAKQYPNSKVIKQVELQIGKLYFEKGDTKEAKEVLKKIIKDYSQETDLCADANFLLAECYSMEGNSVKALEQFEIIKRDYPGSKLALAVPFFIARHYLINEQDKDKATDAFKKAILGYKKIVEEADSDLVMEAGRLMSLCYIHQQKWKEAINCLYNLAVEFPNNPKSQIFLFNIAGIYQKELNDSVMASQIYQELIEKYPYSQLISIAKEEIESLK